MARYYNQGLDRWARQAKRKDESRAKQRNASFAFKSFANGEGNRSEWWHLKRHPGPSGIADFIKTELYNMRGIRWFVDTGDLGEPTREDIEEAVRIWSEQTRSLARTDDDFCTNHRELSGSFAYAYGTDWPR